MKPEMLNRRNFLKSAGVAIALPMLESLPEAQTRSKDQENRSNASYASPIITASTKKPFFPDVNQPGPNYEMPETLKSLEKHRKDITVFQNLDHGFTGGHQGVPVFLSGVRPILAHNYAEGNISLDQKLAEHHGASTRFLSMTLGSSRTQPAQFHPHRSPGSQHRHAGSLQGDVL